jgi:hypothetical protein
MSGAKVNYVLYCLIYQDPTDPAVVERLAGLINAGKVLTGGREAYREDIDAVLADPSPIEDSHGTGHSEAAIRAFLGELRKKI